jgi:hypothetical protein
LISYTIYPSAGFTPSYDSQNDLIYNDDNLMNEMYDHLITRFTVMSKHAGRFTGYNLGVADRYPSPHDFSCMRVWQKVLAGVAGSPDVQAI